MAAAGAPRHAVVVGGGFVGLASALALQAAGVPRVTLVERGAVGPGLRRAASAGNAGTFAAYAK